MTAADSLRQALEEAREGGELLESLTFDHVDASALDFSDLTGRHLAFHACRLTECDLSGAAFYNCDFTACRFTQCRFPVSYWKSCRLTGCKSDGGDFRRSRF